jgi:effector-binding domain-containing protein
MNLAKRVSLSLGLTIVALGFWAPSAAAQEQAPLPYSAAPGATTPALPAQSAPTTVTPTSPPRAPVVSAPTASPRDGEPEQDSPGLPSEATAETLDVPSRPTATLAGKSKWEDGFVSIKASLTKIDASLDKAGLKPAGPPLTVFTETDDNGFSYEAMVPLAAKPAASLSDDVQLGSSPSGKAIKFQHRGPYDDIDSTYDLITAYLDEKNLEARDFFVEEYLSELTNAEDPNLAVDIYVFLK